MDGTDYRFKTAHRSLLLCNMYEGISKNCNKMKTYGPYNALRLRKNGSKIDTQLDVASYGLVEKDNSGRVLQEYLWVNFSAMGSDEINRGLFFDYSGRTKIFYVEQVEALVKSCKDQVRQLGLEANDITFVSGQDIQKAMSGRQYKYNNTGAAIATFDVNKTSGRHLRPLPRQMHITEEYIVEKDASGFTFVSARKIAHIYAIVRSWDNQREFTIEYQDGSSRMYTCPVRDTLLAMILDVARSTGSLRISVTGEVSDSLRLVPRFTEEDYTASIKDAFFGPTSIEAWFMKALGKACRAPAPDHTAIYQACCEFNANVPCSGMDPKTDPALVKVCFVGVLRTLQLLINECYADDRVDHSRSMVTLLQSIYRMINCNHGFKTFVTVKEIDTRSLLIQLLKFDHDFVNYWALEVVSILCRCPLAQRNVKDEFVNKHTLLSDMMLTSLVELMSERVAEEEALEIVEEEVEEEAVEPVAEVPAPATAAPAPKVMAAPSLVSHLPTAGAVGSVGSAVRMTAAQKQAKLFTRQTQEDEGPGEKTFFPNSLVIISAASLLESLISSLRDSSSPELMNKVLDLLAERYDVLIHMFRSSSFLIMENAAILMFVLVKNRKHIEKELKEAALSGGLVLKQLHFAAFSPSGAQRFISRFLVATWMSGPETKSPGKALLTRILPTGLIEYLKMDPINEEQRRNLDEFEDEFYATYGGAQRSMGQRSANSSNYDRQQQIRRRIAGAMRDAVVEKMVTGLGAMHHIEKDDSAEVEERRRKAEQKEQERILRAEQKRIDEEFEKTGIRPERVAILGDSASGYAGEAEEQREEGPSETMAQVEGTHESLQIPEAPSDLDAPQRPENFRILFNMITQDHHLPDLIWNEQTRIELRSTLEAEIKEFEREQLLKGFKRIAWNYQQFEIRYESLRNEMQVGPIYIRHFLTADPSFIRTLQTPSPVVLFEKLLRRVMVNIETDPELAIVCCKCLIKIYDTARDKVGVFDDMMLTVRMLEKCEHMELQHTLLDFLEALSLEERNLQQLLHKDFIKLMVNYVSLAHLNPDQIGNILARATTNTLMLKDGESGNTAPPAPSPRRVPKSSKWDSGKMDNPYEDKVGGGHAAVSGGARATKELSETDRESKKTRTLWVPDDISCPKIWFVAPRGAAFPPPANTQKGPYRVSHLLQELSDGTIDKHWLVASSSDNDYGDDKFDSVVDTGKWKPIYETFQLNMQLLFPGKALSTPADVAKRALTLLYRVGATHKSVTSKGVPFYPVPHSKQIMSESEHFQVFAQLLLCNDGRVVEIVSELVRSLVQYNHQAASKLYLSGLFFFGLMYTGNCVVPLARLFTACHMSQSFQESVKSVAANHSQARRSVLFQTFPVGLVNILLNYGPERFATIYTGDYDTPEVIWNSKQRFHMVDMVGQHLGTFPARMRQDINSRYEYCPIPSVVYPDLDKEIYVFEYYLRNLCDEVRFPEWPIGEPLRLLRECIESWREEMTKGVVDNGVAGAKKILNLGEKYTDVDLRKAYKNLARKYHPDKNPQGGEMFMKIQVAYDLLTKTELQVTQTDIRNVVLLLKTQNIVYRRFPGAVEQQKYPAYPLVIEVMVVPEPTAEELEPMTQDLLLNATMLIYYTCSVTHLNGKEFVKCKGVAKLFEIVQFALGVLRLTPTNALAEQLLFFAMKAFSTVAQFESGRIAIAELCPAFADAMRELVAAYKQMPVAAEYALETLAQCAAEVTLQNAFVAAGLVWKLVPFLLSYDPSSGEELADEDQRLQYNQFSCNMQAVLACKALGRMGGYMFDELASPPNDYVREHLDLMLTQPIAKMLRNRRPWDLLTAVNENCEQVCKIWNVAMRKELLDFVIKTDKERPPGSREDDLEAVQSFRYSNLIEELCISGAYIRIFNNIADINDIENPTEMARDLLDYIGPKVNKELKPKREPLNLLSADVLELHLEQAVEALTTISKLCDYIGFDISRSVVHLDSLFRLLDPLEFCNDSAADVFSAATAMLSFCAVDPKFVSAVVECDPPVLWRLVLTLCTTEQMALDKLWECAEAMASVPDGLEGFLSHGMIPRLLGIVMGVKGYANAFSNRLSAVSLLSKFLWNPVKGGDASNTLRRFLPEPVVAALRSKAGNSTLQVFDSVLESPEFIWTAEMQGELRNALTLLLHPGLVPGETSAGPNTDSLTPAKIKSSFGRTPRMALDYSVRFRQIESELFLGGVYVRLYLKQPTFRLSNPIMFLEKCVEFWDSSFQKQVPKLGNRSGVGFGDSSAGGDGSGDTETNNRQIVLGKEDFLTLATSCIVCVLKGELSVIDHVISWGFPHRLCELIKRALDSAKVGTPVVCCVRIMYELVNNLEVVDFLGSSPVDCVRQLTRVLDAGNTLDLGNGSVNVSVTPSEPVQPALPKEAALLCELMKKIFLSVHSKYLGYFVSSAVSSNLVHYLLDHVIGATPEMLAQVRAIPAMRVHAVDLVKAVVAADPEQTALLAMMLESHAAWGEYRDQSHDLYLTDADKTDVFLLEDAKDNKFVGLLTDGSIGNAFGAHMFNGAAENETGGNPFASSTPPANPHTATPPVPAARPQSVQRPASSSPGVPPVSSRPALVPVAPVPTSRPTSVQTRPPAAPVRVSSPAGPQTLRTSITKSVHGIGLDIAKTPSGGTVVVKLKDLPTGALNPAASARPAVFPGDLIVEVNGVPTTTFAECVKNIRACEKVVTLTLQRNPK